MSWRGPQQLQIPRQCGGGLKASRCLELLWVTRISRQRSWFKVWQAAWLLLVHCATARANYVARVVEQGLPNFFCRRHDSGLWQCLCAILHTRSRRRCGWRRRSFNAIGFGRSWVAIRVQSEPASSLGWLGRCSARHPQSSSRGGSPVGDSTGR